MSINSFRIRLKYKHNKFKQKNKKSRDGIKFEGGELVDFTGKDENPRTKQIFLSEKVIYDNPYNKDDANNGLTATVTKVYEPESYEKKFKKIEEETSIPRGTSKEAIAERDAIKIEELRKQRIGASEYPIKCDKPETERHLCNLYDLVFDVSDEEMREKRIDLEVDNIKGELKRSMNMIPRDRLKSVYQKKIIVTVQSKPNKVEFKKKIKEKIKLTLKEIFKKGTKFKPKYLDKETYDSFEEYTYKTWGVKPKEKIEFKGDIVKTTNPLEKGKFLPYKKNKEKVFKISSINIDNIDLPSDEDLENKNYIRRNIEKSFFTSEESIFDLDNELLQKTRRWIVENYPKKDQKFASLAERVKRSDTYFKSILQLKGFSLLKGGDRNYHQTNLREWEWKWRDFLITLILQSVWTDVNEHRRNGWRKANEKLPEKERSASGFQKMPSDYKHEYKASDDTKVPYIERPRPPQHLVANAAANNLRSDMIYSTINKANQLPCRLVRDHRPRRVWPWFVYKDSDNRVHWEHVPLPPISAPLEIPNNPTPWDILNSIHYAQNDLDTYWQENLKSWKNFFIGTEQEGNSNATMGRNPSFINTFQNNQGFNIFRFFNATFFQKPIIEQLYYISKVIGLRTTNKKLQSNNRGKVMRIDNWPICGIHHFINTYGDLPIRQANKDIRAACDVKRILTGDIICNVDNVGAPQDLWAAIHAAPQTAKWPKDFETAEQQRFVAVDVPISSWTTLECRLEPDDGHGLSSFAKNYNSQTGQVTIQSPDNDIRYFGSRENRYIANPVAGALPDRIRPPLRAGERWCGSYRVPAIIAGAQGARTFDDMTGGQLYNPPAGGFIYAPAIAPPRYGEDQTAATGFHTNNGYHNGLGYGAQNFPAVPVWLLDNGATRITNVGQDAAGQELENYGLQMGAATQNPMINAYRRVRNMADLSQMRGNPEPKYDGTALTVISAAGAAARIPTYNNVLAKTAIAKDTVRRWMSIPYPFVRTSVPTGNEKKNAEKERFVPPFRIDGPGLAPASGFPKTSARGQYALAKNGTGNLMPSTVANLGDTQYVGGQDDKQQRLSYYIRMCSLTNIFNKKITDGNNTKLDVTIYIYLKDEEAGMTALSPTCAKVLDETVGSLLRISSGDHLSGRFGGSRKKRKRKRKNRTVKI